MIVVFPDHTHLPFLVIEMTVAFANSATAPYANVVIICSFLYTMIP